MLKTCILVIRDPRQFLITRCGLAMAWVFHAHVTGSLSLKQTCVSACLSMGCFTYRFLCFVQFIMTPSKRVRSTAWVMVRAKFPMNAIRVKGFIVCARVHRAINRGVVRGHDGHDNSQEKNGAYHESHTNPTFRGILHVYCVQMENRYHSFIEERCLRRASWKRACPVPFPRVLLMRRVAKWVKTSVDKLSRKNGTTCNRRTTTRVA